MTTSLEPRQSIERALTRAKLPNPTINFLTGTLTRITIDYAAATAAWRTASEHARQRAQTTHRDTPEQQANRRATLQTLR